MAHEMIEQSRHVTEVLKYTYSIVVTSDNYWMLTYFLGFVKLLE